VVVEYVKNAGVKAWCAVMMVPATEDMCVQRGCVKPVEIQEGYAVKDIPAIEIMCV